MGAGAGAGLQAAGKGMDREGEGRWRRLCHDVVQAGAGGCARVGMGSAGCVLLGGLAGSGTASGTAAVTSA